MKRASSSPHDELSTAALEGAQAIAAKMNWDLSRALEDAVLAQCEELGLKLGAVSGRPAARQRTTKKGRAAPTP
jgi:hypothetical protein